jgi:hypothetical protein
MGEWRSSETSDSAQSCRHPALPRTSTLVANFRENSSSLSALMLANGKTAIDGRGSLVPMALCVRAASSNVTLTSAIV